jgi:hypothetical protein
MNKPRRALDLMMLPQQHVSEGPQPSTSSIPLSEYLTIELMVQDDCATNN